MYIHCNTSGPTYADYNAALGFSADYIKPMTLHDMVCNANNYPSCIGMYRFHIPMSDEVDDLEAKKDPLMMKAVKAFKANYVSPIQLRYGIIRQTNLHCV